MHKVHNALQELQVVALMLCKMAFWLSGKVVTLHLDNSPGIYFCVQTSLPHFECG